MKRRNFLAAMGLAPVVAPTMLKDMAAQTSADLALSPLGIAVDSLPTNDAPSAMNPADATGRLLQLGMRTAAQHAFYRKRTGVWALDPDLASYRSMSLSARISMQKARNYERELEAQKDWYNGIIAGFVDQ